jgi:hypothetical protein
LEAAIGIGPMNKGFANSQGLFSQVLVDAFATLHPCAISIANKNARAA